MAMDAKDIQARIDGGFTGPNVRNINLDTHIGSAPQRPFAYLEDQMASVQGGYASLKDLQAALKSAPEVTGLPPGSPNPNEIHDDGGGYYRVVPSQEAQEWVTVNGVPKRRIRYEKRRVASSMAGAKAASEAGTPTDFWNGFTWLRVGFKPEQDFQVMLQLGQRGVAEDLVFDADPSPTDVAQLQHDMNRLAMTRPPLPAVARSQSAAPRKEG